MEFCAMLAETEIYYTQDSDGAVVAESTAVSGGVVQNGYTKHGGAMRSFDEVMLVCNQKDYLQKVMPATTVLTTAGTYQNNIFPFPTDVVRSNAVPEGKALLGLPKEYFMGIGTSKDGVITFSDDFRFLDDQRVFKIKMHGMGKAFDDTCFILLDISNLEELFIYVKAAEALSVTVEQAAEENG